jgi:hypothetical protein
MEGNKEELNTLYKKNLAVCCDRDGGAFCYLAAVSSAGLLRYA